MKHIFNSAFDLLVMAFCGAWLFYGIEGAGNIFKVWVWLGAIITACAVMAWLELFSRISKLMEAK
ncbi:MAG TPA: hypothetical protein PKW66_19225 [Polyangiaceae bacterium]|nr:hypothetical protein [Polyangiaceae bacterium]